VRYSAVGPEIVNAIRSVLGYAEARPRGTPPSARAAGAGAASGEIVPSPSANV
jgi:hypothetical protein